LKIAKNADSIAVILYFHFIFDTEKKLFQFFYQIFQVQYTCIHVQ
jgi:hypothetical protein